MYLRDLGFVVDYEQVDDTRLEKEEDPRADWRGSGKRTIRPHVHPKLRHLQIEAIEWIEE